MPFDDFETITKDNMPPVATLSYHPFRGKHGAKKDAKPKLTITVPTTVSGVSKCARFKLQVGTGTDAGKLRVVGIPGSKPTDKPGVKPSEHASYLKFNFGFVPAWGSDKIAEDKYPLFKIDDDTFEIAVPASWCEVQK